MSTRSAQDPRTKDNMDTLFQRTLDREATIIAKGYKVKSIWSCQWAQMMKDDPSIREFVEKLDIVSRLCIRDSFFG